MVIPDANLQGMQVMRALYIENRCLKDERECLRALEV
jgi:hypothetical protein